MAQFDQPSFDLAQPAQKRRRGRPAGAKNRRSIDLARYVEATFGGMTPGQQAAELAMVKPADLKRAREMAAQLGLVDVGLSPMMLAMAVKARQLAKAIGCEPKEAWLLLQRERSELIPYIHQRQAPAAESKGKAPATVFIIPEGEAGAQQLADFSTDDQADEIEIIGDFQAHDPPVGNSQSDDDA